MDVKLPPPSVRRRRPWAVRPWTLVVLGLLLVAGPLIQACSDNNATTGPTFSCNENPIGRGAGSGSVRSLAACPQSGGPVPVVGDGTGGATGGVVVFVTVSPGTVDRGRRASVTVVATSKNGVKLGGTHSVFLTTSVGSLDASSGTMSDGVFQTSLLIPCDVGLAAAGNVVGIVDGASSPATGGAFTIVTATSNNPCP